jgi:2-C-methyl-D-erythritol 4-phosphate cytidylyltransferase/2-C-methyl-D-erythritol 2,4-cyclodiphosphate synthase
MGRPPTATGLTTAIVVAAGRSERFGGDVPKVLVPLGGRPLIATTLDAFDACDAVDHVVLVASEQVEAGWSAAGRPGAKVCRVVPGGTTRQGSVAAGLAVVPDGTDVVLVHDGARPFASAALIRNVAVAARRSGAALPVLSVVDTVKRIERGAAGTFVAGTIERETLGLAQTPQGFRVEILAAAHAAASASGLDATDDVALVEAARAAGDLPGSQRVEVVPGEPSNKKVTVATDIPATGGGSRIGLGHDVHPLAPGRPFVLAGVDVWSGDEDSARFGPVGHSDGDALTHATCDALLSAAGLGDIGTFFPDTAPENRGRPSLEFLADARARLASLGWRVANVSAVLQLERPKLAPHAPAMREAIARTLGIDASAIGISAKRGEGLGDVGAGQAIRCDVVALLERT